VFPIDIFKVKPSLPQLSKYQKIYIK